MILTGLIQSGKTTALQNWIESRKDVIGILSPDLDGERVFMHIPDGFTFPMIAEKEDESAILVGKYCFSQAGFAKANELLIEDLQNTTHTWLLFDEIGPLELADKGLFPALTFALNSMEGHRKNILIVVREKLVDEVMRRFNLDPVRIITREELTGLN